MEGMFDMYSMFVLVEVLYNLHIGAWQTLNVIAHLLQQS